MNGTGAEEIKAISDGPFDCAVSDDAKSSGDVARDESREAHHSFLQTGLT